MPEVISMEGQVGVGYRVRALEDIDGIAVHYFAADLQDFFDYPIVSGLLTQEEEESVVLIVDEYHEGLGYGGIGYHFVVFPSRRVYSMGSLRCQRAGVANHNRHLVSFAFPTAGIPLDGSLESGTWLIGHIREQLQWSVDGHMRIPVKGHRQWAHSEFSTDCPGEEWESWLPAMIAGEGDMIDWPLEKEKLSRDFEAWLAHYPLTQEEKDNEMRQVTEDAAAQRFYRRQISWRLPAIGG